VDLKKALEDQATDWKRITKLKRIDLRELRLNVAVGSLTEAFARSADSIKQILSELVSGGMNFSNADPGHGLGHFVRDCLNAMRLADRLDADPKDIFIGILAGIFHDIGCAFVNRYDEPKRLIRHAEAAALILNGVFELNGCGLNQAEQLLVEYSVAAHTHYLKPTEFKFGGKIYVIEPYRDEENGKPILAVWLPRWIDRLECNGPTFVARHYLTLATPHKDFSGEEFFEVNFSKHLRPLLRTPEEIREVKKIDEKEGQTMLEHLNMFADSQTNLSPYGRHDYGAMVQMREAQTARLTRIIAASNAAFDGDKETVLRNWDLFLKRNIEPTESGARTVTALNLAFSELPEATQKAWISCFAATLSEYRSWEAEVRVDLAQMHEQGFPRPEETLSEVADVLSMISPAYR